MKNKGDDSPSTNNLHHNRTTSNDQISSNRATKIAINIIDHLARPLSLIDRLALVQDHLNSVQDCLDLVQDRLGRYTSTRLFRLK